MDNGRSGTPRRYLARFAQAVAEPGSEAGLIGPRNELVDKTKVSLNEALADGGAFFVEVAANVLAVDADRADSEGGFPSAEAATAQLQDLCESIGLRTVVLASGQEGRRHLFARVDDPKLKLLLAQFAKQLGLDVRSYIRPPLAPHRWGLTPELLMPSSPEEALDFLEQPAVVSADAVAVVGFKLKHSEALRQMREGWSKIDDAEDEVETVDAPGVMSRRITDLLEAGDPDRVYPSGSEVVQAIVTEAVRVGMPFEELVRLLEDPRNAGGDAYRRRLEHKGDHQAELWLKRSYQNALDFVGHGSIAVAAMRKFSAGHHWPANTMDHKVYDAMLAKAVQLGRLEFDMSTRELGELAGVGRKTAGKALRRLEAAQLVERVEEGAGQHADTWALLDPPATVSEALVAPHQVSSRVDSGHDVWRRRWRHLGGLGSTARDIFSMLLAGPAEVEAVAAANGRTPVTVRNNLRNMQAVGLAEELHDGRWAAVERDLDAVAEELRAAGRGARQREVHDAEREGFRRSQELAREAKARRAARREANRSAFYAKYGEDAPRVGWEGRFDTR